MQSALGVPTSVNLRLMKEGQGKNKVLNTKLTSMPCHPFFDLNKYYLVILFSSEVIYSQRRNIS